MSHLTTEQRYEIAALLKAGIKQIKIAEIIGKDPSVICRELKRNSHSKGYSAKIAQQFSDERKERFSENRKFNNQIKKTINEYLEKDWSPEQIVGYCKSHEIPMVSTERIYQFIRQDKRDGGLLYQHTRHKLKHRKRSELSKQSSIKDRVFIDQRPDIINNKERFGDWEIDLIVGPNNKGAILTLVERKTKFLFMFKLKNGKEAKSLSKQLIDTMIPYKDVILSITSDNGSEFADYKMIINKLKTDFYFTFPYSPWQKGLVENTNGLIRQYIPKDHDFDLYNDIDIKNIQYKINSRPRKNLNFMCPKDIFYLLLNKKIAFAS